MQYTIHLLDLINLPSLLCQLDNSSRYISEPLLKSCPPPLTIQPLPLQSTSLMESLLVEILLDLVPRHQAPQHANTPNNVTSTTCVQVNCAPICRVQTRIVFECGGLLCGQSRWGGLVGQRGVRECLGEDHVVKIQARGARKTTAGGFAEFGTENMIEAVLGRRFCRCLSRT